MSDPWASIFLDSILAALGIALAVLFWKKGTKQFKNHFVAMSLMVSVLAIGYLLELVSDGLALKLLWNDIEYVSIAGIPVVYFAVVVKYAGREELLTRGNLILITAIPAFTMLAVWTNDYHHLFYSSVDLAPGALQTYSSVKGPIYLLHLVYSIGLVVAGMGIVFGAYLRAPRVQRTQISLVLISSITPTAYIATASMGVQYPFALVDGMIISFILSSVALYLGVFRFGLFYATPLVLNSIADVMQDGAIMLDQNGRITYLNPVALQVLPGDRGFPLGRPISDVFPSIHAAIGDEVKTSRIIEMLSAEGHPMRLEARVTPVRSGQKDLGRLVILRDITSLTRSEAALATSNTKLEMLYGVTRHDILNRTNVIRGYGHLIKENKDGPRAEEYLNKMIESTMAIEHIINFTKEYVNVGIVSPEWQDVSRSYQKAKVLCADQSIEYVLDTGNTEIFADPMLERLFYILLDNSYKHGSKVSRISLSAVPREGDLTIIYEDDGVGVMDSEKTRIFQKGYGKDTGLGLYLGMQILGITGISIVENGTHTMGARFEMVVPKGMWRTRQSDRN